MDKKDLLLEIGTEEIPARFLPSALEQLNELAARAFSDNRLSYDEIKAYATPRRLVIKATGLAARQPDSESAAKGPSLKAAYEENGQPSKALSGFARSQGVEIADLKEKETGGNIYLYALKKQEGRPASEILPDILANLVNKITFPKPMRWAFEEMRFARPIRWLVLLWDKEILPLTIAGVESGRLSRGHRVLGSQHIVIDSPLDYEKKLADNYVIVDQAKRRELVLSQIKAVAEALGGRIEADEELLSEVVFLLEYPTALSGRIEEKFLAMPQELVITPMRDYQRYFPVYDGEGRLLPYFITVRNGDAEGLEIVAQGNEKVLSARLCDAEFFWTEDCKVSLEHNLSKLAAIVYHEKLGSLLHKVECVRDIAAYLGRELGYDNQEAARLDRTAYLMKADLVSRAVYEFTELQGIMGEYYALKDGEEREVAQAIREHYLPRFFGDALPQTKSGTAAAIADKIFSVAGFFAVGIQPTGSQDPYALRRAAIGISQIIIKNRLDLSVRALTEKAYDLLGKDLALLVSREDTVKQVYEFFGQRLENILSDYGVSYDIINAVTAAGYDNLYEACLRADALKNYRNQEGFNELLAGFTRAANILKKNPPASEVTIEDGLFEKEIEKVLYEKMREVEKEVKVSITSRDYAGAFAAIGSLRGAIDAFFTDVMVMVENQAVQNNRLALLQRIVSLTDGIGNLALIVSK